MNRLLGILAAALTVAVLAPSTPAAIKPTNRSSTKSLPEIWQKAGPQERLKALRVAELDGTRLLVERIYGVQLDADTTVYDLVMESDKIRSEVSRVIRGVSTTEEPEYLEDGSVQVVRAVKLRQVLETISRTVREKEGPRGLVKIEDIEKVERKNKDTTIDVMGNGALPDSKGLRRIQAKRAAEVDGYRRLAERILGVRVLSNATVKDFVLESDEIRARTSQIVQGAKPVAITYDDDDSCEVKMQVKVADIFHVIRIYSRRPDVKGESFLKVQTESETQTFTETGRGAPRPEGQVQDTLSAAAPKSEADAEKGAYRTAEVVIRRLVGQGVVVD